MKPLLYTNTQAYTADSELMRSAIETYLASDNSGSYGGGGVDGGDGGGAEELDEKIESIQTCLRGLLLNNRSSRSAASKRLKACLKSQFPQIEQLTG